MTWKDVERRIADLVGGQRVPINGRGSTADVAHDLLSIEVKHRDHLPSWLHDAMGQAQRSIRATRASIKDHLDRVAALGCCLTGSPGAVLHHCRSGSMSDHGIHCGASQKPSDWLVIPLLPEFHTGDNGIHTLGVETWELRFGTQFYHLCRISRRLGYNVFQRASYDITI